MKPKIKTKMQTTFHKDGSVSYWSIFDGSWKREMASMISDKELSAMIEFERRMIELNAKGQQDEKQNP